MQPKQKPQTRHACTQRLIETRTDRHKQHTHRNKHRNIRIRKNSQIYIKQIQYKLKDLTAYSQLIDIKNHIQT